MKPYSRTFLAAAVLAGSAVLAAAQSPDGSLNSRDTRAVPTQATAFQGGARAPELTTDELRRRAATAKTRADHLALAERFATLAQKEAAEADDHVMWARAYRAGVRNGTYEPAVHFDWLAHRAREAAQDATNAANLHRQLANVGE